jgi:hypothetical protein
VLTAVVEHPVALLKMTKRNPKFKTRKLFQNYVILIYALNTWDRRLLEK